MVVRKVVKGIVRNEHKELGMCAYQVIEEEGLPKPFEIKYTSPGKGTKSYGGRCSKNQKTNDNYKIIICLKTPTYVQDPEGKLFYKNKPEIKYRRAGGKWKPFKRVIQTMAHEIAHLRFWEHGPTHTCYTANIEQKLIKLLGEKGITPDCDPFE